ncbi:MAG: hypothetical protein R3C30_11770 [Hyphomonadaceae bacterium]
MVLVAPPLAEERVGRSGRDVKLIPYHRFEIVSALPQSEALRAIASRIEERKWFRVTSMGAANDERFDGTVSGNKFNVTRIMGYRNSFAPVIEGEINEGGRFSRITITMRPSIIVVIFLGFFSAIFLSVVLGFGEVFAIALAAPFLVYGGLMAGFWFEASKLEQTFRKIFQAM